MMVVHMLSPDDTLRPALRLQLRPQQRPRRPAAARRRRRPHDLRRAAIFAARLARPGQARRLRPDLGRRRAGASRSRTCRSPAARIGQEPTDTGSAFQITVNTQGRFEDVAQFRQRHRALDAGRPARPRAGRGPRRARRAGLRHQLLPQRQAGRGARRSSSAPAPMRSQSAAEIIKKMEELKQNFPPGVDYQIVYNPTEFIAESRQRGLQDAVRGGRSSSSS